MPGMTADEIKAMQAGRDLDVLIMARVFGQSPSLRLCSWYPDDRFWVESQDRLSPDEITARLQGSSFSSMQPCYWSPQEKCWRAVPAFSTDISAAWEIVDEMQTAPRDFYFQCMRMAGKRWVVGFEYNYDICQELPLVICRAALLAMEAAHEG